MAKQLKTKKVVQQKYMVLEQTHPTRNWTIEFEEEGFSSVQEAMDAISNLVAEDPLCFEDYKFKIAAVTNEVVTVNVKNSFTLDINKGE